MLWLLPSVGSVLTCMPLVTPKYGRNTLADCCLIALPRLMVQAKNRKPFSLARHGSRLAFARCGQDAGLDRPARAPECACVGAVVPCLVACSWEFSSPGGASRPSCPCSPQVSAETRACGVVAFSAAPGFKSTSHHLQGTVGAGFQDSGRFPSLLGVLNLLHKPSCLAWAVCRLSPVRPLLCEAF